MSVCIITQRFFVYFRFRHFCTPSNLCVINAWMCVFIWLCVVCFCLCVCLFVQSKDWTDRLGVLVNVLPFFLRLLHQDAVFYAPIYSIYFFFVWYGCLCVYVFVYDVGFFLRGCSLFQCVCFEYGFIVGVLMGTCAGFGGCFCFAFFNVFVFAYSTCKYDFFLCGIFIVKLFVFIGRVSEGRGNKNY